MISYTTGETTNLTKLYFGGIFGGGAKPHGPAERAVYDINKNRQILPSYELVMLWDKITGTSVSNTSV